MKQQQNSSNLRVIKGAAANEGLPLNFVNQNNSNGVTLSSNNASAQKLKINRAGGSQAQNNYPSSIMKPRDSSSSVGRGNSNNSHAAQSKQLGSNYQSIVSNEKHVSFDKNSAYNSNPNSTALASLIVGSKYGNAQGNGLSGLTRKKSPIDAQVAAVSAYKDENAANGGVGLSGNSVGKQLNSLAEEYKQMQKRMDERLKQEIENHAIAPVTGKVPAAVGKKFNAKDIKNVRRKSTSPLQSNDNIINTSLGLNLNSQSDLNNPPLSSFSNPLVSGSQASATSIPNSKFFRSQRSVAMRIKDSYENELQGMERGKLELIQRLNDALLELDRLNQEKSQLSNALIQQIQFVRDLQRETTKGEDIKGVVSEDLKMELRQEKELCLSLKEELKHAEQERLRILARLQELGEQLQTGEVKQGDLQVEVSVRGSNCEQLVREIEGDREDAAQKEQIIHNIREQLLSNNNSIKTLREGLEQVVDEKREAHHRMSSLQDKYEEVVRNFEREQRETHDMQTRHIKLITSNILFESLKEIHRRNLMNAFNYLKTEGEAKFNTMKGLVSLRATCKRNRRSKLKRYLYLWFSKALNPMRVKQHKKRLAVQLRQRNPSMLAFYQWQLAFQLSHSRTHKFKSVIQKMLDAKNDYHLRAQKFMFIRWRDMVRLNSEDRRRILVKYMLKRHREYLAKYFSRWLETSQELDTQIQMNGLALRLAFRKYKSVLFFGWRQITADWKSRRIAVLNRAFKNMKVFTLTRKQLRAQTWSVLREQKNHTHNLFKACFDAWRIHKEERKLLKVVSKLNSEEYVRQQQAKADIQEVSLIDQERLKVQATRVLMKCFGKVVFQYWQRWKDYSEAKRTMIQVDLKQRVITVYLRYLRDAFNKFIQNKGQALIQSQSELISEEHAKISEAQTLLVQSHHDIEERKQRQQCLSSKQIKKILTTAYEKRLREHFQLWRVNLDARAHKQDSLEKVVSRLNRRQKRQSFDRYRAKVQDIKRELKCDLKVKDMLLKLDERLKSKVFKAILSFSQSHLRAKNYLRRLLTRLDLSLKETIFKRWQKYENYKSVKLLQLGQNEKVENLSALQNEFQLKSDQLENLNQQNKKLYNSLANNGRRLIRLAFTRCLEQTLGYGFKQWVAFVEDENQKRRKLAARYVHLFKGTLAHAFRTWSNNIRSQMQMIYEEGISSEDRQIAKIESDIKATNKLYCKDADQASTQLEKLRESQKEFMSKHQNCLRALITRKDNQDFVSKKRHILQTWHQFVRSRKKCIALLQKVIQKTLWHQGLEAIKAHSLDTLQSRQQAARSRTLVYKYAKIKTRYAFAQWREFSKRLIVGFTEMLVSEEQGLIEQRDKMRSLVQERAKDQMVHQRKEQSLFDVFNSWKNYSQNQRLLKVKMWTYQTQSLERDKQRAIAKWQARVLKTQRFAHQKQIIDRVYERNLLSTVLKSWKEFNYVNKRMAQSLSSLAHLVDKVYLKQSFKRIWTQSEKNHFRRVNSKARGAEKLFDQLQLIIRLKRSQAMNELRRYGVERQKQFKGLKSILKYQLTRGVRELFNRWKEESERKSLIKFMSEEGPVAIQNHNLKKMIYNLKLKTILEGFAPKEVNELLVHNRRSSLQSLEKSICRLVSYKDAELYLLPKCLDQWKKYVQYRKLFRHWLNYLNNKADSKRSPLFWAFQRWKYGDLERRAQLSKQPKEVLLGISCKNEDKMRDLVGNLELADATTDELTEQRDLLLKRYVGSQRLALAVINGQNELTKQKAISRWSGANSEAIQTDYEDALKENLRRIQALKDRIKHLESSNHDLADQNEELRQGAMDGIEMAQQIDDLNKDREKLSVDLADKAITIKKLLEDNNNLSIRLGNAQEEAQNLIRMSQMRLEQSAAAERLGRSHIYASPYERGDYSNY